MKMAAWKRASRKHCHAGFGKTQELGASFNEAKSSYRGFKWIICSQNSLG